MNAGAVLSQLSALGARVECRGDKVMLCFGTQLIPDDLIVAARACKAELAAALNGTAEPPTPSLGEPERSTEWWRDEYEERAAIREFDGRYTRAQAERLAWGELENRWHSEHGERIPLDVCAGCRQRIGRSPALDVGDGTRVHDVPDHACLIQFGKRWRACATQALVEMGLKPPELSVSQMTCANAPAASGNAA